MRTCNKCEGTGKMKCDPCEGTGNRYFQRIRRDKYGTEHVETDRRECQKCNGRGFYEHRACDGRGYYT